MIVLYQKRQNIYEIIYAEIMMARLIIMFPDLSSLLFTAVVIILFTHNVSLPIVGFSSHLKTIATN